MKTKAFRRQSQPVPASGRCFLCGLPGPDTTEHVVPKCLYGMDSLPSDLVTLPAHAACNRHTSKHEEVFRNWIAASIPTDNPGHRLWTKTWRSLQRPQAKGLKLAYYKDTLSRFEHDHDGNRVAVPVAVTLRDERTDWVLGKIIKGLFTNATGLVLPNGGIRWRIAHMKPGGDSTVELPYEEDLHGVASVRWGQAQDEPATTIWVIGFYGVQFFHASTRPTWRYEARSDKALVWPGPDAPIF